MIERFLTPSWRTRSATAAIVLVAIAASAALAGCNGGGKASGPPKVNGTPTLVSDGLQIIDITVVPGGRVAENGHVVRVNYTGWLADGTEFDSSASHGQPLVFLLGDDPPQVIVGLDEGITGMTVGSKRRLIIPPDLAYGAEGSTPVIPPNAALTFDVELLAVQ
jgi:FKBP-type peptidyl-prolyl cis-trans isomerase